MILSALVPLALGLKPFIVVPGHNGYKAWVTVKTPEKYSCPADMPEHFPYFPMDSKFAAKYPDCTGWLCRAMWDNETGQIRRPEGIIFEQEPWGDIASLTPYLGLTGFLQKQGYVAGKDLLGIPHDWVLYFSGLAEPWFDKLARYIENVTETSGEKVVLMGHSMGSHVVRMLTTVYRTAEWTEKYVDRVVFIAPAFGGCFSHGLVTGNYGGFSHSSPVVVKSSRQVPAMHTLWDNYVVFEGKRSVQNVPEHPEGILVNETIKWLIEKGDFDEEAQKIFAYSEAALKNAPIEPAVPTLIIYNSGIQTGQYLNYQTGGLIRGPGDGTCSSGTPQWSCEHWKNPVCLDYNTSDSGYNHGGILSRDQTHQNVWRFMYNGVFVPVLADRPSINRYRVIIACGVGAACLCLVITVTMVVIIKKRRPQTEYAELE